MLLVFSGLGLAFTEPIAKALVDLIGGGQGDWDPKTIRLVCHSVLPPCKRSKRDCGLHMPLGEEHGYRYSRLLILLP